MLLSTDHEDDQDFNNDDEDDEDAGEVLKLEALPNTQPPGSAPNNFPFSSALLSPGPALPCLPFLCPQHPTLPGLAPLVTQVAHTLSRPFPAFSLVEK